MLNKIHFITFNLFILLSLSGYSQSQQYKYLVKVDHLKKHLNVEACFNSAPPYFYAANSDAQKVTNHISWKSQKNQKNLELYRDYIYLPKGEKGCLSYQIDATLLEDRLNSTRFSSQHPNDFILSIGTWLWKPADYSDATKSIIKFKHSAGINISAPWTSTKTTATQSDYIMQYTPDDWSGYVAFGKFDIQNIKLKDRKIRLALINGNNKFNKAVTIDWIKKMTSAVASIGGDFPVKEVQVLVIFQKGSRGAVPWGQVNRAGGSGVLFIVNPDSSPDALMQDWTAAHEFSHLLMPYTPDDRWLSEGFASYYQNISRARTGLIKEDMAWGKLIAGFERGLKAARKPNAPVLKSANMRSLMQMYWGGAVIALKADVALQEKSFGKYNLSHALKGLSDCCLHTRQSWSARETFARLDKITGTDIFSKLYYQEVMQRKYPEYMPLLKELGIIKNDYGNIILDNTAPKADIRNKIING